MQRKLTILLAGLGASVIAFLVLAVIGLMMETGPLRAGVPLVLARADHR